jgi:hypothetical protein
MGVNRIGMDQSFRRGPITKLRLLNAASTLILGLFHAGELIARNRPQSAFKGRAPHDIR